MINIVIKLEIARSARTVYLTTNEGIVKNTNSRIFLNLFPNRVFGSFLIATGIGSFFLFCSEASIGIKVKATTKEANSAKVTVKA